MKVDSSSLRQALGMPLNDLFENQIYHGHIHSETLGDDVEDADNGASASPRLEQPQIDPPRRPSPEVQIPQQEYFGDAVVNYKINEDA